MKTYEALMIMPSRMKISPNQGTKCLNPMLTWHNLLSPLHRLLAPPGTPCLTCGKMISDSVPGYPEICLSCYASIPWIREPRCLVCGRPVGCPDCSRHGQGSRVFLINRSAVGYNAFMREWLAEFKFRGNEEFGSLLARMTGRAYGRMLNELRAVSGNDRFRFDAVTYVPVSTERLMERGFNQSGQLALGAASAGKLPLVELLERSRHTEKQSFKNRRERLHELHGVFRPAPGAADRVAAVIANSARRRWGPSFFATSINGKCGDNLGLVSRPAPFRVLLVDDVYTTGSTAAACSRVLLELCGLLGCPVEIYSLTWARS